MRLLGPWMLAENQLAGFLQRVSFCLAVNCMTVLRGANGEYGNLYTYLLSTCDDKRGFASGDCGEIIYSDRGSLKTDSLNLYLQASRE